MSLTLAACDGTAIAPSGECTSCQNPTANFGCDTEEPIDSTFCECQLCQVYSQVTYTTPSPPLENAISTTVLQPSVASTHTLCLNHWTFLELNTDNSSAQVWQDAELSIGSSIQAALGSDPSTPHGLVLTLDTHYDEPSDRFTTVDAFLHLSPTRPLNWYQLHS